MLGVVGRKCVRLVVVELVLVCATGLVEGGLPGSALACENERFRVGPSANLPDCRAYELMTPANLGRTQTLTFSQGSDFAIPSSDGEHLALESFAPIEPSHSVKAGIIGTRAIFSRTPEGWRMRSAIGLGMSADHLTMRLFSPDLSQVALASESGLNQAELEEAAVTFEIGPIGGVYVPLASGAGSLFRTTKFVGANNGTAGVPPFSDVLLTSGYDVLPPGPERTVAEKTAAGFENLYEWTGGRPQLVNVNNEGGLLNPCGADLGEGGEAGESINAVSADGSKVFFTSPQLGANESSPEQCTASRLYMRVDGRETVEVSAPQGVELSTRANVVYHGATADGSKVFFSTATQLTPEAPANTNNLYAYDTNAPTGKGLRLVASGLAAGQSRTVVHDVVASENGSVVYWNTGNEISRYEEASGKSSFVARLIHPESEAEPASTTTTPNGEFLLFTADGSGSGSLSEREGVEGEPRGAGVPGHPHNELYRYDNADKTVICVSCGGGVVPEKGTTFVPAATGGGSSLLGSPDGMPSLISMSEDGRRVFFQTSAQLVAGDTNVDTPEEEQSGVLGRAADIYEWEADGTEEAPGLFCEMANGCTHLISAGEDVGPSIFLGASRGGRDVFFATAAQLVPQATPEFTNIYDARIGGGFPSPPPVPECSSCQGVGSTPPLFGPGASLTFAGAGNPSVVPPPRSVTCRKGKRLSHGRCVKLKRAHRRAKAGARHRAASGRGRGA